MTHPPQPSLIALSEAATPGPWKSSVSIDVGIYGCGYQIAKMTGGEVNRNTANSEFVVALVNHFRATQSRPEAELPELPEPEVDGTIYDEALKICYTGKAHYTADQLRAYGQQCAASRPAEVGGDGVSVGREIDLSLATKHEHPDIKLGQTYFALIGGTWHFGKFDRQWYGWHFSPWVNVVGLQFDAPGWNSSKWQRLIEITLPAPPAPGSEVRP